MMFDEAKDRYLRDPQFKQIVDIMVHQALSLQMSPGELREAAVFAEIRFYAMKPARSMYPHTADRLIDEMNRSALSTKGRP